eukprot:4467214-Prymnesium_polylepis.1
MHAHAVACIFNPGETAGFLYTVGLDIELFSLDVPYSQMETVAGMMNYLSERAYNAGDTAMDVDGRIYHLCEVEEWRRAALMRTHLTQIRPTALMVQLSPMNGWPQSKSAAPANVCQCKGCRCVECEA